ncbi:hypothetical protein Q5752_005934 [Cryptotrichosporon argae]
MGRDDLSYLDALEEWLEAQVPTNLHDLPFKMLETVERVSAELFESLNMHGPPSISLPFPPFKEPPPPPPPPASVSALTASLSRAGRLARTHPVALASGAALVTVGLGLGIAIARRGLRAPRRGLVQNGMLREAIVVLAPSPTPPLLVPLAVTLLKAGYVVIVAVPHSRDADALERRLGGMDERAALRVLIYDPDDYTTFPPFHRSLLATLSLRFPGPGALASPVTPHVHAYVSLYPLHPSPPSHPGGLPALPSLFAASGSAPAPAPRLVTLYPAAAALTVPDTFAAQALSATHRLLAANLAASTGARTASVYVGDVDLPPLPALLSPPSTQSRRDAARARLAEASPAHKPAVVGAYIAGSLRHAWASVAARLGLGSHARDYAAFDRTVLAALKPGPGPGWGCADSYAGAHSYLPFVLARLPGPLMRAALARLPPLSATGPAAAVATGPAHAPPAGSRSVSTASAAEPKLGKPKPTSADSTASASSSDHEHSEEMVSSIHTGTSASSAQSADGLDGSWVGLDPAP